MASIIKRMRKVVDRSGNTREKKSRCWYIQYRNGSGKIKRIKGYTDFESTKQKAAKLEIELARGREGLSDPFAIHDKRPLMEHIGEFLAEKREQGCDSEYVY